MANPDLSNRLLKPYVRLSKIILIPILAYVAFILLRVLTGFEGRRTTHDHKPGEFHLSAVSFDFSWETTLVLSALFFLTLYIIIQIL
ncbi:MAG: hypothetical protein HOP08_13890 [Cyclobacteriaceae bacterium]|nr:hypothetical protein [Cyclobacteriaceae bacterium]